MCDSANMSNVFFNRGFLSENIPSINGIKGANAAFKLHYYICKDLICDNLC